MTEYLYKETRLVTWFQMWARCLAGHHAFTPYTGVEKQVYTQTQPIGALRMSTSLSLTPLIDAKETHSDKVSVSQRERETERDRGGERERFIFSFVFCVWVNRRGFQQMLTQLPVTDLRCIIQNDRWKNGCPTVVVWLLEWVRPEIGFLGPVRVTPLHSVAMETLLKSFLISIYYESSFWNMVAVRSRRWKDFFFLQILPLIEAF